MTNAEIRKTDETELLLTSKIENAEDLHAKCKAVAASHSGFARQTIETLTGAVFDGATDPRVEWKACFQPELPSLELYLREHLLVPTDLCDIINEDLACCLFCKLGHTAGYGTGALFYGSYENDPGFRMIANLFDWTFVNCEGEEK